jgi:hypothetical protein
LALDVLQLEYVPSPMGNNASKSWSGKVAFWLGKVARSVFSFAGYKLPEKYIVNSSKTRFKSIPTSFPFLRERSK